MMEFNPRVEADRQPNMRHAKAIEMAARLSIFGTLIDRVASIIRVKRAEEPRRTEKPNFVVISRQMTRPAALEALYDGIYEKAIAKRPSRRDRRR